MDMLTLVAAAAAQPLYPTAYSVDPNDPEPYLECAACACANNIEYAKEDGSDIHAIMGWTRLTPEYAGWICAMCDQVMVAGELPWTC